MRTIVRFTRHRPGWNCDGTALVVVGLVWPPAAFAPSATFAGEVYDFRAASRDGDEVTALYNLRAQG